MKCDGGGRPAYPASSNTLLFIIGGGGLLSAVAGLVYFLNKWSKGKKLKSILPPVGKTALGAPFDNTIVSVRNPVMDNFKAVEMSTLKDKNQRDMMNNV
jgi:hypothetical protein